jgi:two-component system response regulator RegX3
MDGMAFLARLRERSDMPVIIVSSRDSDEEKIRGLGLGADDFIPKPFSPRFLAARAAAQLRREALRNPPGGGFLIRFGDCVLDRAARVLKRGGEDLALTRREYELLDFLCSEPGKSFGAEELFRRVWGKEYGDLSTVAVHVQRLRRKIEPDPASPRYLLNSPGLGYRFEAEGGES